MICDVSRRWFAELLLFGCCSTDVLKWHMALNSSFYRYECEKENHMRENLV